MYNLFKLFSKSIHFAIVLMLINAYTANAQCPSNIPQKKMASSFHTSIMIDYTGAVRFWGEAAAQNGSGANVLSPLTLTGYTGTPKSVAASSATTNQHTHFLHTTDGVFGWGYSNRTLRGATPGMRGLMLMALPTGVSASQISFIESSLGGLALVTNSGAVYIKQGGNDGSNTALVYGDGTTGSSFDTLWHKVRTSSAMSDTLTGVVELSYGGRGLMVITSAGNVYVWGDNVWTGASGGGLGDYAYATLVTKPTGVTASKVEIVTKVTYDGGASDTRYATQFILGTDGKMYGIGEGNNGVLGQGSEADATSWVTVRGPGGVGDLTDIVQIGSNNPLVYSGAHYNAGALTSSGKLYLWGDNGRRMIGSDTLFYADSSIYTLPRIPPNFSYNKSNLGYFEMGGHTTAAFQQGSTKFCYIGHKIKGSMGDGVTGDEERWSFDCINTPDDRLCPPPAALGCPASSARDIVASAGHATLALNGAPSVTFWGEASSSAEPGVNVLSPRTIDEYTGTPLSVAASGVTLATSARSTQMWLQTTSGLYAWGTSANTIFSSLIIPSPMTQVDLPLGVTGADVNFIRSSRGGVAIVTNSGNVYVRAGNASSCSGLVYGDGSSSLDAAAATVWHQVTIAPGTPLAGVVELSFAGTAALAVTNTSAYVWGANTYLGDGTVATNRNRATLVTLPTGVIPRSAEIIQVGSNEAVQFLVGKNNKIYCIGRNLDGALGKGVSSTTTIYTSWDSLALAGVKKMTSNNPIANGEYSLAAITILGDVYLWGSNSNNQLGFVSTSDVTSPTIATTIASGDAAYVEMAGQHTIIFSKTLSPQMYFAGRRIGGSRADGNSTTGVNTTFALVGNVLSCANTAFSVSGNLYIDTNRLSDNLVNGIGTNTIGGTAMHVNLIDESGYVIATKPISAGGTYSFTGVPIGNYKIQVSPTAGTLSALPPTTALPVGYTNTAEQIGTTAGLNIDGNADGIILVNLSTNTTNVNFGISPTPPVAQNIVAIRINNSSDATAILSLQASSPMGVAISKYVILTIPPASEGVVYYCASAPTPCAPGSLTAVTAGAALTEAQSKSMHFDPAPTFTGNSTFTYLAYDANNMKSNVANYNIPVYNNPPLTQNITTSVLYDTYSSTPLIPFVASDADGTIVSYSVSNIPGSGGDLQYCSSGDIPCSGSIITITSTTTLTPAQASTLTIDPTLGFSGNYVFNYTATDNNGNVSNTSTYTIPITNGTSLTNQPPVATNVTAQNINNNEGATAIPKLLATDPDGTIDYYTIGSTLPNPITEGTLTYCTTPPSTGCGTAVTTGMTLTPEQAETLSFDPVNSFIGTATFQYTATDNVGLVSNVANYNIPIVNNPPVAHPITVGPISNTITTPIPMTPLSGSDYDGTVTSYNITSVPPSSQGTIQYCIIPGPGCVLTTISGPTTLTPEQVATLAFTPSPTYTGDYILNYTVTDNNGQVSNTAPYIIPVHGGRQVGLPPVAYSYNANPINSLSVANLSSALSGTDPDGTVDNYTVTSITPANEGTLSYCTTGSLPGCTSTPLAVGTVLTPTQAATVQFTPNVNFVGIATFTYLNHDNDNNVSNTATVTIPVTNNPPVAQNISNIALNRYGGSATLNPLVATDNDGTVTNYTILSIPPASEGTLRLCTTPPYTGCSPVTVGQVLTPAEINNLTFEPDPWNRNPIVNFTYKATDNSNNQSNIATVSIPIINAAGLPLELIAFNAQKVNNQSLITWETAKEPQGLIFKLEHASDGKTWKLINKTIAKGKLNSNFSNKYSYAHKNPNWSLNYYRLILTDIDNKVSYSPTKILNFESSDNQIIKCYPNPVIDELTITTTNNSSIKNVHIYNIEGKLIVSYEDLKADAKINMKHYKAGIYSLQFEDENGNTHSVKVVKE